jgi:hypothetical protein
LPEVVKGMIPTVPEYYQTFINKNVNLLETPKQCCPFHEEDTPSFSYMRERGLWRCFGACKTGGDVYELHRKHYKLKSRDEAKKSLHSIYGVQEKLELVTGLEHIEKRINQYKVDLDHAFQLLVILAGDDVERWLELDYAMSKYPPDLLDLQSMINKWRGITTELEIDYEHEFIETYYEQFDKEE